VPQDRFEIAGRYVEGQRPPHFGYLKKEAYAGPRTCGWWRWKREPRRAAHRLLGLFAGVSPPLVLNVALATPVTAPVFPVAAVFSASGAIPLSRRSPRLPAPPMIIVIPVSVPGAAHGCFDGANNIRDAKEEGVDQRRDEARRLQTHPNGRGEKDQATEFQELVVGLGDELVRRRVYPFGNKTLQFEEIQDREPVGGLTRGEGTLELADELLEAQEVRPRTRDGSLQRRVPSPARG
jgi:hypothetical protein